MVSRDDRLNVLGKVNSNHILEIHGMQRRETSIDVKDKMSGLLN